MLAGTRARSFSRGRCLRCAAVRRGWRGACPTPGGGLTQFSGGLTDPWGVPLLPFDQLAASREWIAAYLGRQVAPCSDDEKLRTALSALKSGGNVGVLPDMQARGCAVQGEKRGGYVPKLFQRSGVGRGCSGGA